MSQRSRVWVTGLLAVSFAALSIVVLAAPAARADSAACRRTYASTTGPYPINDNSYSGPSIYITVPDAGTVVDVDVTVNISHPYDQDLWIYFGNNFRGETLAGHVGGSGANFTNTTFDDEASIGIGAGTAPFTGRFQPEMPLSRMDGSAAKDTWRVGVTDTFPGSTGTFLGWSMTIEFASCDADGDGVEDHHDSCLGLAAATTSGCPAAGRTLTAKYRHGAFRGSLASGVSSCAASQPVTIWKVRSGSDRRVGTAVTRSDGSYRLLRARKPGRYYVTTSVAILAGVAECAASTSPRFRIR
jgi:hypothetical protein